MERSLFNSFYEENIEKIAKRVVEANLDSEGKPIFEYHSNPDGVYEEYLNQRTLLRTIIKNSQINSDDNTAILMNGHKIAALITCSIIKVRLITSPRIEDGDFKEEKSYSLEKAYRMNEQVALLSGLSCLLEFMVDNKENLYVDSTEKNKLSLFFARTAYEDRSSYLDSLVRTLYYSNTFSAINPLLLSHIFFQIEAYHRKTVEFENYKQSIESQN